MPPYGHCYRNPPTALHGQSAQFPLVDTHMACFAGEPAVQRSCGNCGKRSTAACDLNQKVMYPWKRPDGWHCCEWEAKDATT